MIEGADDQDNRLTVRPPQGPVEPLDGPRDESDEDGNSRRPPDRFQKPEPRAGLGLPLAALIIPLVAASINLVPLFAPPLRYHVSWPDNGFIVTWSDISFINWAVVITTAILMAVDANHLGPVDRHGVTRMSGTGLGILIFIIWIVFYPYAFFRRRHFAKPELAFAGLVVTLLFVASTSVGAVRVALDAAARARVQQHYR